MANDMHSSEFVDPASNHLIAWVGKLTEEELEHYLEEPGGQYDKPHSEFMRDLGRFYDHDFIFAQAADQPVLFRELARLNGLRDEGLITEIERRVREGEAISAFIILWNYQLKKDLPGTFAGGKLRCIGSWAHPRRFQMTDLRSPGTQMVGHSWGKESDDRVTTDS